MEAESDQLAKQCVKLVEEIGELRTIEKNYKAELTRLLDELVEAKKDAARLEWLNSDVGLYDIGEFIPSLTHQDLMKLTLREGIDKAMEEQS